MPSPLILAACHLGEFINIHLEHEENRHQTAIFFKI